MLRLSTQRVYTLRAGAWLYWARARGWCVGREVDIFTEPDLAEEAEALGLADLMMPGDGHRPDPDDGLQLVDLRVSADGRHGRARLASFREGAGSRTLRPSRETSSRRREAARRA